MSYGFDDNMGKVPIEPILNNLQTNFQNNINTIYNTIVNQGTTPPGRTPAQIATGINNLATNKYNAGRSAGYNEGKNAGIAEAQSVAWSQSFHFAGGTFESGGLQESPSTEIGLRNVTAASITNASNITLVVYFNSAGAEIGRQEFPSGNLNIPSTAHKMKVIGFTLGPSYCDINLSYKCQVLR